MSNLGSLHPKVHAEIQLLMFYESHPDLPSPRVISSSKSACFLCNLFLQRHGRFYTGRTHGVLYPNWAMPNIGDREFSSHQPVQFKNIINGFVLDIEQALRSSIISQRRRSHPNESVAVFPSSWSEHDSPMRRRNMGTVEYFLCQTILLWSSRPLPLIEIQAIRTIRLRCLFAPTIPIPQVIASRSVFDAVYRFLCDVLQTIAS